MANKMRGSHSSGAEGASLLGCDTVSLCSMSSFLSFKGSQCLCLQGQGPLLRLSQP
jgi:hypothetical protein